MHRGGKNKDGNAVVVTDHDLDELIDNAMAIGEKIHSVWKMRLMVNRLKQILISKSALADLLLLNEITLTELCVRRPCHA